MIGLWPRGAKVAPRGRVLTSESKQEIFKLPHQMYTAQFKHAPVQRVKDKRGVSAVVREFSMSMETLWDWLTAAEAGKLNGPGAKVVTAEQMEQKIARKAAFFAKDPREVHLD